MHDLRRMQFGDFRFWREVVLAGLLAVCAGFLANFPPFDHFGGISLALIGGMLCKAFIWRAPSVSGGLAFASKTLLRLGIVLLGTRLNFGVLIHAGPQVIAFDLLMIVFGITLITFVLRRTGFEPTLAVLAAVGSSICGASAIAAAAPTVRANKENSALAIVVCTLIGTIATFLVIPLYSIAGLAPERYGILAGATLHEVAQVAAAVAPVPDAFQTGMVAKLLRVVFLAPVVALLPRLIRLQSNDPVVDHAGSVAKPPLLPWYVAGFLLTGLAVTLAAYLPDTIRTFVSSGSKALVQPANLLIGTSMAAIGLQVDFATLKKHGPKLLLIAGAAWLVLFSVVFALCLVWR
jgi:uncharacterized integral membrane protein (TIGR00698 family)